MRKRKETARGVSAPGHTLFLIPPWIQSLTVLMRDHEQLHVAHELHGDWCGDRLIVLAPYRQMAFGRSGSSDNSMRIA